MIYVSIDIETTGLDFKNCDIIQFAAVIDDLSNPRPIEELPKLVLYFVQATYSGEPYALSMHPEIFKKLACPPVNSDGWSSQEDNAIYCGIEDLPTLLRGFLRKNGLEIPPYCEEYITINVAGKNAAGFDIPFLKEKIKNWQGLNFNPRVIDPAILYYKKGDKTLPNTKTCMERAGISGEVAHTALEDALVVVKLIRNKML